MNSAPRTSAATHRFLVTAAWRLLGVERFDDRDFLTTVRECVEERDRLRAGVADLRRWVQRRGFDELRRLDDALEQYDPTERERIEIS